MRRARTEFPVDLQGMLEQESHHFIIVDGAEGRHRRGPPGNSEDHVGMPVDGRSDARPQLPGGHRPVTPNPPRRLKVASGVDIVKRIIQVPTSPCLPAP